MFKNDNFRKKVKIIFFVSHTAFVLLLASYCVHFKCIKMKHFCKGYITGVLNMQTILILYKVYLNYTGCNMKKKLSLI